MPPQVPRGWVMRPYPIWKARGFGRLVMLVVAAPLLVLLVGAIAVLLAHLF